MALYRRANSEALNDTTTDNLQSHRCMLHKGTTPEAFMRDPISVATSFPRFEARNRPLLPWRSHTNALVLQAVFSRCNGLKNAMAATLEAEYSFYAEDLESRVKVVKFAVIQRQEKQGAAQEHELASFEAMMLPHMDAAYNLARWLLRNEQDAQDVVQEAYLRAFKSFSGFHGSNGRAWLLTIVRNTSYTLLKKNRAVDLTTTFDEEIHAVGHESVSPATILEHAEDAELIKNAMEELPAEFREILTLRHQESLSYNEIGETLKIPIGTVMSRLARARARLKEYLAARISQEK
jgi:RNA polymerase sigma factor (sigma-70 family)